MRTGIMLLPLHDGKAPRWLAERMKRLSYLIAKAIVLEHGHGEFLARLSDPLWFQAFGCVLGYDWHSSGVTTVVTGVLKQALLEHGGDLGLLIAGGKGRSSRLALDEISAICDAFSIGERRRDGMLYASRMAAKVDNMLLQDGHALYHHAFIVAEDGSWAVVQQGMDARAGTARRYHWLSTNIKSFVNEPRSGMIIGSSMLASVLDMTASESEECRRVCVDLANDANTLSSVQLLYRQSTLDGWLSSGYGCSSSGGSGSGSSGSSKGIGSNIDVYSMPRDIDWHVFKRIYDAHPRSYEELVAMRGVGAGTIRALALIAELVYGARASWRDPVRFTFAHGGKDGVPYPVDRRRYDESIRVLRDAIEGLDVESSVRMGMLKGLSKVK